MVKKHYPKPRGATGLGSSTLYLPAPKGSLSGSDDLLGDLVAKAQQGARGETGALELLERENDMRNLSKKAKTIIAGAAVIGLISAGGAYAYWTITGSGSGSATTGSVSAITVNQTSSIATLSPGGSVVTLSGTFTNPGTGTVHVSSVTVSVGTLPSGCVPADFTISGSPLTVSQNVLPGATGGAWTGVTIKMNDTGVSQNSCQGMDIPLVLASS